MKLVTISLAVSFFVLAVPAYAVKTKDCPAELKYEITELELSDDIEKQLDQWLATPEEITNTIKVIDKFFSRSVYRGKLTLIEAKNAVCKYAVYGSRRRAKFYTKKGRNILRLALPARDNRDFGFYMTVGEYNPNGLVAKGKLSGVVFEANEHAHDFTEFEETIDVGNAKLELE